MVPYIPLELVDLVASFALADEDKSEEAQRTCMRLAASIALVCKAWYPIGRKHLCQLTSLELLWRGGREMIVRIVRKATSLAHLTLRAPHPAIDSLSLAVLPSLASMYRLETLVLVRSDESAGKAVTCRDPSAFLKQLPRSLRSVHIDLDLHFGAARAAPLQRPVRDTRNDDPHPPEPTQWQARTIRARYYLPGVGPWFVGKPRRP
ncbi:hypothetical protein JCM3770_000472, partial [Rhodotorula araucariae]